MTTVLSVFLGGGIGSILRHLVCAKIGNHWAVMSVNLQGAMLIGIAFEYFANKANEPKLSRRERRKLAREARKNKNRE